jgi:hypothetical protein
MKPSFRTIRPAQPLPEPLAPIGIYDPSVRPFPPKIELAPPPYTSRILADYNFNGHEIVSMPSEDSVAVLMRRRIEWLLQELAMKKERALEDFLCSGAMPRDISVEEGHPVVHTHTPADRAGIFLVVDQPWRVK